MFYPGSEWDRPDFDRFKIIFPWRLANKQPCCVNIFEAIITTFS